MQCVWKEGGCELNPLYNMGLLDAQEMFRNVRKFGKNGTAFLCAKCAWMEGERQLMSFALKMLS